MGALRSFYSQGQITPVVVALFPLLWVLSLVYAGAMRLRRLAVARGFIKPYRSAAKVVSVGNITLGGSGKTPMAAYLADYFARRGRKVAILMRGYRKPGAGATWGDDDFRNMGDEASMLKKELGRRARVVARPDRAAAAAALDAEGGIDLMILDDGFQHLGLARNLDIVLVDATRPFGNGHVLPAGPLREPLGALRRADVLCVSRADEVQLPVKERLRASLAALNPKALLIESVHRAEGLYDLATGRPEPLSVLSGVSVGLFCGIANPASFVRALEQLAPRLSARKFFADHHLFSGREIEDFMRDGQARGVEIFVTTQKDAQRLAGFTPPAGRVRLLVLKISLVLTQGEQIFHERLSAL